MAQVRLISRDFNNLEVPGGLLQKRDEIGRVVGFPATHVHAGNNMGVHAAHQMYLDPFTVVDFPPVLLVVPSNEAGRGEATRVNGELSLYGFERETAYSDQVFEDWRT